MFEVPEIKIVNLSVEDIITASGVEGDGQYGSGEEE